MNIYFSGLGGVGIGPLAMIARDMGHDVRGSDLNESRYTNLMNKQGFDVQIGQTKKAIAKMHKEKPIELFVYTAALPPDHEELAFVKEHNIPHMQRGNFVNQVLKSRNLKLIAVAGTHGKTTTTAMIVWMLQKAGINVSYAIGTNITFGPAGRYSEGSEFFIYEADEYARMFLNLKPHASVITTIEHDHPDHFKTEKEYMDAFVQFASQSTNIFGWNSDLAKAGIKGAVELNDYENLSYLDVVGNHNRRNARVAVEMIEQVFGEDIATLSQNSLKSFPGTERRFEKVALNLYSDYAHHPSEISAVLQMAKELGKEVVAVYQPHQNARQHEIVNSGGYGDSFKNAEHVYWLPTYLSREDPSQKTLVPADLIATLSQKEHVEAAEMNDLLFHKINDHLHAGHLVVLLAAGDADEWLRNQLRG